MIRFVALAFAISWGWWGALLALAWAGTIPPDAPARSRLANRANISAPWEVIDRWSCDCLGGGENRRPGHRHAVGSSRMGSSLCPAGPGWASSRCHDLIHRTAAASVGMYHHTQVCQNAYV